MAAILRDIYAYTGEHDLPLCPHATLDDVSQKWQMKLHPTFKRKECHVTGRINLKTCNSETPLILKSGDAIAQSGNHCPLCLMTTAYTASTISDDVDYATHDDRCPDCRTSYGWQWYNRVYEGRRYSRLDFSMAKRGNFEKPTDKGWLNSLEITGPMDPRGDAQTKHLLWCDDRNCATFRKWGEVGRWVDKDD